MRTAKTLIRLGRFQNKGVSQLAFADISIFNCLFERWSLTKICLYIKKLSAANFNQFFLLHILLTFVCVKNYNFDFSMFSV